MKIECNENQSYVYYYYEVNDCKDKYAMLLMLADAFSNPILQSKKIRIEDGKSFHDGTESDFLYTIEDKKLFADKYSNIPLESVSLSATYKNCPFALTVIFENLQFKLSCIKDYMVEVAELEQILGLV